jgi:hypothetical protein
MKFSAGELNSGYVHTQPLRAWVYILSLYQLGRVCVEMNSIWGRRVAINRSSSAASLSPTLGRARFLTHCERARVEWQQLRTLAIYVCTNAAAPSMRGGWCVAAICSQAQVLKFERPSDHSKTAPPFHSSSQAPAASVWNATLGWRQIRTGHRLLDREMIGCVFYHVYPLI